RSDCFNRHAFPPMWNFLFCTAFEPRHHWGGFARNARKISIASTRLAKADEDDAAGPFADDEQRQAPLRTSLARPSPAGTSSRTLQAGRISITRSYPAPVDRASHQR